LKTSRLSAKDPEVTDGTETTIRLDHVSKTFPMQGMSVGRLFGAAADSGFAALSEVSFQIRRGETVGFLGSNGAGKSTMLQLIAGTMQPTMGSLSVKGRISALLELGAGFNPEWTGRRNAEFYCMIQGASAAELPECLRTIEDFADIGTFFEQPMRTYSSGMFLRVAFAAAIAVDPDIVIVDEALAVGDARFQNKCFTHFKKMQASGKTILFVTHDTVMMSQFCTRGIVLQGGRVVHDGEPDEAVRVYRQILYGGTVEADSTKERVEPAMRVAPATGLPVPINTGVAQAFTWPPDPALIKLRAHYNAQESSAGMGHGQIVDLQLLDEDRHPRSSQVTQGQRLGIAMQITASQRVERPCYGIVVKSKDNVYLYGVTNIMLGQEMPPLDKDESIAVCFDIDTNLARGDYFIDLGFSEMVDGELKIIEWRMSVGHFSILAKAEIYGLVDLGAHFTLGDQQSAQ
jgi:lipopolysaccharide transport system ATP-binding protein